MRSNRHRDTAPELRLRRALHALGHRYRVSLPVQAGGVRVRPDIVFPRQRVAVFVDGCFWHCCALHGRRPADPTGYWTAKLDRNVERDRRVTSSLEAEGWRVVRIWEHEPVDEAVTFVAAALVTAPHRRPGQARAGSVPRRGQVTAGSCDGDGPGDGDGSRDRLVR
jgi:DNA mismatch endonuclease (patch repair protein)